MPTLLHCPGNESIWGPSTGRPLLVYNARVHTMDPACPQAEAFSICDGRFDAVGKNGEILLRYEEGMEVFDAKGLTIIPGFIDAHMHPNPSYPVQSPNCVLDLGPDKVKTLDDLLEVLREKAGITAPGEWICGYRYNDRVLGRHPTRWDLDRATTEHPILLTHSSYHVFAVNSYALQQADVVAETPDPAGGSFDRDTGGTPNGVLREPVVRDHVLAGNRPFPVADPDEEMAAYLRTFDNFAARGITSVADAAYEPGKFALFERLVREGLQTRVYCFFREEELEARIAAGQRTGQGDRHLKLGALKIFHGNSLTGHTCWLSRPYANDPDYCGIPPERSQAELNALILRAHEGGFQVAVHANGDREIEMVVEAFEHTLGKSPRADHRHRIEHASVMTAPLLERIRKLGLVLAPHSYLYEHGEAMEPYGEERYPWLHPNRKALDAGITIAGNSDYPISAADPLLRIQSLATRQSAAGRIYAASERLTVEEGMHAFTLGAARSQFEEKEKGSITPGKLADCVLLAESPSAVEPARIGKIEVVATFIGGQQVYPSAQEKTYENTFLSTRRF